MKIGVIIYPSRQSRFDNIVFNRVRARARAGVSAPGEFVALDHMLHDMRLFKSAEEVRTMQQALSQRYQTARFA